MAMVDKLIIQLNETLQLVEECLARIPDTSADIGKQPISAEVLNLIQLLHSVDATAFEAAENLRENLPATLPVALRETFNQFFIYMKNYDMEAAAECLENILPELQRIMQ